MLEPRRSHYLRALGIDVYVPRFILPGAAASQAPAWEEITADAAANTTGNSVAESAALENSAAPTNTSEDIVITAAIGDVAATVRQRSLPADLDIEINPAPRRSNSTGAAARANAGQVGVDARAATTTVPKFALSVVVSAGILVIDDAPPNTAARSEYLRLLGNILLALRAQPAQPQLDIFLWPAVKHPQLDQGAEAARETLAAYLYKQIQQHTIDTVLLLGDAAQQWCAFDQGDGRPEALRCIKSVSALACLQAPQNKRQLWQDIRHLATVR